MIYGLTNSKGGVGKTTIAVLKHEIAKLAMSVAVHCTSPPVPHPVCDAFRSPPEGKKWRRNGGALRKWPLYWS